MFKASGLGLEFRAEGSRVSDVGAAGADSIPQGVERACLRELACNGLSVGFLT